MNEIGTLKQAKATDVALADSAQIVFLRVVTEENCWEQVFVELPVREVHCSEDVLAELLKEVNRLDVIVYESGVWICYPVLSAVARSRPGNEGGEFVGQTFIGRELKEQGFSIPLLHVLHGNSANLFAAILATREENPHLFDLLEYLLRTDEAMFRRLIVEGIDVNTTGRYNFTLLHCACRTGRPGLVAFLLGQGANVHAKHKYSGDPFSFVLGAMRFNEDDHSRNNDGQILRLLADFGAEITCDRALRAVEERANELRSQFGDDIPETILYPKTKDDIRDALKEAQLHGRLQEGREAIDQSDLDSDCGQD